MGQLLFEFLGIFSVEVPTRKAVMRVDNVTRKDQMKAG
jgi:hypothetical protein